VPTITSNYADALCGPGWNIEITIKDTGGSVIYSSFGSLADPFSWVGASSELLQIQTSNELLLASSPYTV
jgi:hypothetical protein